MQMTQLLAENEQLREFVNSIAKPIEPEPPTTSSEPRTTKPPNSPAEPEAPLSTLSAFSQTLEAFRDEPIKPQKFDE